MKAVILDQYGDADRLRIGETAKLTPGEGEVVVKVAAAGINPFDWMVRAGYFASMIPYKLPLILGVDVAGVVSEVGPGATRFQAGDAVFGMLNITRLGGYAEYVSLPENDLAWKPDSLSFVEAASIPAVALTSRQALVDLGQLKSGERVLIHAGAGGIGSFAVQLAKALGAYVVTTASDRNHQFLRDLGADEVIDYHKENFAAATQPVDLVLDTIGGEVLKKSMDIVKSGGRLVSLVEQPDEEAARSKGIHVYRVNVQPNGQQLGEIGKYYSDGKIKTVVQHILPLEKAAEAHRLSETKHTRGKIVLEVTK